MSDQVPEQENCFMDLWEQIAFLGIVQHETYPEPRVLLDMWARAGDTNPHAGPALTATLAAMWRQSEGQEQDNG